MSRTPWSLYDSILDETYYWPINPSSDDGSHNITRSTKYEVFAGVRQDTSGSDRIDSLVFFGGDDPSSFSYSGYVYTLTQLEALEEWAAKDYAVILTDDLERQFNIIIQGLKFDRVRSNKYPARHNYTITGFVLSEIEE